MAKRKRQLEAGGMSLSLRLSLIMTLALAAVMTGASVVLYKQATQLTSTVQESTLISAARLTGATQEFGREQRRLETERDLLATLDKRLSSANPANTELAKLRSDLRALWSDRIEQLKELQLSVPWRQVEGAPAVEYEGGLIKRLPIEMGASKTPAYLLRYSKGPEVGEFELLSPQESGSAEQGLLRMIIVITGVVILVGMVVSLIVASGASRPIAALADDVWQISTGDLTHKVRARGVREVNLLAGSIDRMTTDLAAAQEARVALSVREREVALAGEVRESLLANATPVREGYEFGALALSAADLGGDFYDFISTPSGQVGLLVCDVSGRGLPATLVGATARAYLRAELSRGEDLRQALFQANRELARDVRRGMYVSALYALLDPKTHRLRIACAGHKLPLVHFDGASGKVRAVQPEGIALGFDRGPIFESRLEIAEVALAPGDRLTIFNSGPAVITNPEGKEYGEKQVYAQIQRHGAKSSEELLDRLRSVLEAYVEGAPLARDVSILTARRVS